MYLRLCYRNLFFLDAQCGLTRVSGHEHSTGIVDPASIDFQ